MDCSVRMIATLGVVAVLVLLVLSWAMANRAAGMPPASADAAEGKRGEGYKCAGCACERPVAD